MGNRASSSKVVAVDGEDHPPNIAMGDVSVAEGEHVRSKEGCSTDDAIDGSEHAPTDRNASDDDGSSSSEDDADEINPELEDKDEQAEFNEEIKNMKKKMSILCCGPTGVGKSTLLNGLMGEDKWFHVEETLDRGTPKVEEETFTKNDIEVTVWDTPGLEGGTNDEEYLQEIKRRCSDFDLFLYCTRITEPRCTDLFDEKSSLVKFTDLFGVKNLWKKTVVILTHANSLLADLKEAKELNPAINVEEKFADKISTWKTEIRQEIQKLGFKKAKEVPVVPAGIASSPSLPGYPHWLGKIFKKAVDRIDEKARNAYLKLSNDRIRRASEVDLKEIAKEKIENQPFVISRKFKAVTALASSGVSAVGTLTGAGTGAAIGALLFGIPTFGALAGGGLVVGGIIGAGVGLTTSLGTAYAIKYFKRRRHRKLYKVQTV